IATGSNRHAALYTKVSISTEGSAPDEGEERANRSARDAPQRESVRGRGRRRRPPADPRPLRAKARKIRAPHRARVREDLRRQWAARWPGYGVPRQGRLERKRERRHGGNRVDRRSRLRPRGRQRRARGAEGGRTRRRPEEAPHRASGEAADLDGRLARRRPPVDRDEEREEEHRGDDGGARRLRDGSAIPEVDPRERQSSEARQQEAASRGPRGAGAEAASDE